MKLTQILWGLHLIQLDQKNRLPRGFKRRRVAVETPAEFQLGDVKPYDLSQFKPFETIMFGTPPRTRVTRESLALFHAIEGFEYGGMVRAWAKSLPREEETLLDTENPRFSGSFQSVVQDITKL